MLSPAPMNDGQAIALALEEAKSAALRGEVPVGAVLLGADGALLAQDGNRILELKDPTAHAEMLVMRKGAAALGNERLIGSTLYVSLEPCAMCAGAMAMARIGRLVFGADSQETEVAGIVSVPARSIAFYAEREITKERVGG